MKKLIMFIFGLEKEEELKDIYGLIIMTICMILVMSLAPLLLTKVTM